MKIKIMTPILCSALLTQLVVLPELLYSQSDFYRGKTIRMVHGRDAGGSGDLRVKALVPFLQKYIPGNPTVVHEFMPGGGGRKAGNYIFGSAAPDGLTSATQAAAWYRARFSAKRVCNTTSINSFSLGRPIVPLIIFS